MIALRHGGSRSAHARGPHLAPLHWSPAPRCSLRGSPAPTRTTRVTFMHSTAALRSCSDPASFEPDRARNHTSPTTRVTRYGGMDANTSMVAVALTCLRPTSPQQPAQEGSRSPAPTLLRSSTSTRPSPQRTGTIAPRVPIDTCRRLWYGAVARRAGEAADLGRVWSAPRGADVKVHRGGSEGAGDPRSEHRGAGDQCSGGSFGPRA